jgi:LacI family transcriptional regulator
MLDVANLAGVSLGTVSNFLNRPHMVAPGTAARVTRAIEDLGFVRNAPARLLRGGKSQAVGAVVLDLSSPFFGSVVRGIEDRLGEDGLALVLCSSRDSVETERRKLRLLEEQRVLGVLLSPMSNDTREFEALRRRGTPVVLLDREGPKEQICSVAVDDIKGGEVAMGHLLEQGHHQVVFLNGPRTLRQCADRRSGAFRALRKEGLDPNKVLTEVTLRAANADGGERAVAMLAQLKLPTAIFCVNDHVAMGALRGLRARGLAVPDDVAVVGYDDLDFSAMLSTPLTSVHQPMYELGSTATSLLLEEARGGRHHHQRIRFTPELVVRGSSRPGTPNPAY